MHRLDLGVPWYLTCPKDLRRRGPWFKSRQAHFSAYRGDGGVVKVALTSTACLIAAGQLAASMKYGAFDVVQNISTIEQHDEMRAFGSFNRSRYIASREQVYRISIVARNRLTCLNGKACVRNC